MKHSCKTDSNGAIEVIQKNQSLRLQDAYKINMMDSWLQANTPEVKWTETKEETGHQKQQILQILEPLKS